MFGVESVFEEYFFVDNLKSLGFAKAVAAILACSFARQWRGLDADTGMSVEAAKTSDGSLFKDACLLLFWVD